MEETRVMNCPYSSVVERQSCKLKVRSSILRGGIHLDRFNVFFSEIIKTRKHDHKDRAAAFFRQDYEERLKSWFVMGTKTKPIKNNERSNRNLTHKKQTLNDEEKKHILEYNYGCFLKYFLFKNILK